MLLEFDSFSTPRNGDISRSLTIGLLGFSQRSIKIRFQISTDSRCLSCLDSGDGPTNGVRAVVFPLKTQMCDQLGLGLKSALSVRMGAWGEM